MGYIKTSLRLLVFLILVNGILYQLLVTGVAQVIFPHQSNGSLIYKDKKVIGSELVGQAFNSHKYFSGRLPDILNGIGTLDAHASNYSIKTSKFYNQVASVKKYAVNQFNSLDIPSELITGSGSGLDPHISRNMAYYQLDTVAIARGVSSIRIKNLVDNFVENPQLFILGDERINLLQLNLALDKQFGPKNDNK